MRLILVALLFAISYAQTGCLMRERKPRTRLDGEILVVEGQSFTVVTDITSCEALCVHHHAPECNGFSFSVQNNRCFLKTAVTGFLPSASDNDISSFCERASGESIYAPASTVSIGGPATANPGKPQTHHRNDGFGIPLIDNNMNFPGPPPYPPQQHMPGLMNMGTPGMMNCESVLGPRMCTRNRGCVWKGFECDNINCETQGGNERSCAQTPGCSWVLEDMKCNDYEEGIGYAYGGAYSEMPEGMMNGGMMMGGMMNGGMMNGGFYHGLKLQQSHTVEKETSEFYNEDGSFRAKEWIELKQSICPELENSGCNIERACEWKENQCHARRILSKTVSEKDNDDTPRILHQVIAFTSGLFFAIAAICTYHWRTKKTEPLSELGF